MLAASTVSGVWPLAAKARSSVAELQKQLTTAEQQAQVATKRAEAAEQEVQEVKQQAQAAKQQAQAAKQQAKMRVWVSSHTQSWQGPIVGSSARHVYGLG